IEDSAQNYQLLQQRCNELIEAVRGSECTLVLVTNEVGAGIVPANRLAREFRDLAGLANQIMAGAAEEVYLVAAGIPVNIKRLAEKL
ncbi:MAG: bifunctional adenosylcobinamide kinase/adenosylcobinamide-phosphate guanylyltransferase, partial [Anaerovibrio sp.]|nr:bifunctional adenosylcobinamide kinase/adenosylcobinamide-phosphate guanylyltransferase [Anaerovibrio sp.]